MFWINFLHIYQPIDQQKDILERIVNESYRPLVKNWLKNPKTKITLNINACLTEMLVKNGYHDVVSDLKKLSELGRVEFTASAKYHPFLPILPKSEIVRQIKLNNETNQKYFGKVYSPDGFFPPEMGYSTKVAEVVANLGYKWLIVDEIAFNGQVGQIRNNKLYFYENKLYIFFRERKLSNHLSSAISTGNSFWEALKDREPKSYLLTAMDGETFGHHRPGLQDLLDRLITESTSEVITLSQVFNHFKDYSAVLPLSSTWATTEEELQKDIPYYLYYNPYNKLHRLEKKLIDLAIKVVERSKSEKVHRLLDQSLSCNHMWWSNPDSWWSIEELEKGAYALNKTIQSASGSFAQEKKKSHDLYDQILYQAFTWARTGLIRKLHSQKEPFKKVPFKQRAGPGQYQALRTILKKEEELASTRQEYELAIKWRDARILLEKEVDGYQWVHILDELRSQGKLVDFERLTAEYQNEYKKE